MKLTFEPIERDLILRYGYPLPEVESALAAGGPVSLTRTDLEQLAGDLSRSINHGEVPDEWLDLVDALCDRLERELQRGPSPRG